MKNKPVLYSLLVKVLINVNELHTTCVFNRGVKNGSLV